MKTGIDWKTSNSSGHATAMGHAWIDWRLSEGDKQILICVNEKPALKIAIVNSSDIGPELIVEENKTAETNESMAACQRAAGIVGKYDALLEAHNAVGEILNSGRRFILQMEAIEQRESPDICILDIGSANEGLPDRIWREWLGEQIKKLSRLLDLIEIADSGVMGNDDILIDRIAISLLASDGGLLSRLDAPAGCVTRSIDRLVWLQEHVFPGSFISVYREEIAGKRFRAEMVKIEADWSLRFSSEASSECLARLAVIVRAKLSELRAAETALR